MYFLVFVEEFFKFFESINKLDFEATPDYSYLKTLFKQLFVRNQFTYENILYDWEVKAFQQRRR